MAILILIKSDWSISLVHVGVNVGLDINIHAQIRPQFTLTSTSFGIMLLFLTHETL